MRAIVLVKLPIDGGWLEPSYPIVRMIPGSCILSSQCGRQRLQDDGGTHEHHRRRRDRSYIFILMIYLINQFRYGRGRVFEGEL